MCYKIKPLFLGSKTGDKSDSMYLYPSGEEIRCCYCCYLVEGNGIKFMVDVGMPSQEYIKGKPFTVLGDAVALEDALKKAGAAPEEIDVVILTHLHYDHCFNLALFPKAKVYVQKKELAHALAPMPCERRIYSLLKECGKPGWLDGVGRFEAVDGDAEIMPGVRVILTPGHSPGSQSVVVETNEGSYVMTGDYIPIMDNFEKCIPNTIHNSLRQWYESYDKIKQLNARLLPGHDMCVFHREVYG